MDFSLQSHVPAPEEVNQAIKDIIEEEILFLCYGVWHIHRRDMRMRARPSQSR